jgi:cyanophycinase-like exopeptidase
VSRLLAIMGSAETTPTMIKPHRRIFASIGDAPAVMLDTPYGFQENADDITARAQDYFTRSVGRDVQVASYRSADVDALTAETARTRVREAGWVFAGPGSPTYALRAWRGSGLRDLIVDKLERGGAVVFSSAAALTVGLATVPVYEIYKAGEAPRWDEGLDLLAPLGLRAAVIPHYDNAEGGHHDTRFCYLGERRLVQMEALLPDDACVLGVDEHTVLTIDLDAGQADVAGLGTVTVRRHGVSVVLPTGTTLTLDELRAVAAGATSEPPRSARPATVAVIEVPTEGEPAPRTPLLDEARRLDETFTGALAARDVPGAVGAILELEETLEAWRGDNAATDEPDRARGVFRSMLVRLGELAVTGAQDPRALLGPVVEVALAERVNARSAKDWAASDRIRDALGAAGVEVRDTPEGQVWVLS